MRVVYRTIPTSNHNSFAMCFTLIRLYIVLFLHQTTTCSTLAGLPDGLYIVLFLHQTTTGQEIDLFTYCCISYYSYIKPQPIYQCPSLRSVVYRTIPTSNHNRYLLRKDNQEVVYRTIPTSNHNQIQSAALAP